MARQPGVSTDQVVDRLLRAAATVFAEKGYDRAGVQEIAQQAGFTTGAIYGRFRGKADLLGEALRVHGDEILPELNDVDAASFLEALRAALERSASPADADSDGLLFIEALVGARRDPHAASVLATQVAEREALATSLARSAGQGGSVDPDVAPVAVARLALLMELGAWVARAAGVRPLADAEWNVLIDRLVRALQPEGASVATRPSSRESVSERTR